jgi:hypothetical protein
MLTQNVDTGMSGVSCADWDASYDQALADSIAGVSGGSILQQNVEVLTCTDVEDRRRVLGQHTASHAVELLMKRKLETTAVDLKVKIIMILEESGIADITKENAFSMLSTMIQTSVDSGTLQTRLNAMLVQVLGEAAPVLSVNSFAADPADGGIEVARSREPTSMPSGLPAKGDIALGENFLFLVSVGVVSFTILLIMLYFCAEHLKNRGTKVYVADSNLDVDKDFNSFTNIKDEDNTVQKPSPDASLSRKVMVHDNKVIPYERDFKHVEAEGSERDTPLGEMSRQLSSATGHGIGSGSGSGSDGRNLRSKLISQDSEKMINLEGGGGTPFSELREMMRVQELSQAE